MLPQETTEQVATEAKIWYQSVNWQSVIDRMAEGLGTTGEYLWTVLVEGMAMEGIAGLIQRSIFLVVFGLLGVWSVKQLKSMPYGKCWDESNWCRFWLTGLVPLALSAIVGIVFLSGIKDDCMKIGAPEYKAIEFLITEARH